MSNQPRGSEPAAPAGLPVASRVARWLAAGVAGVAGLVLLGWAADIPALRSVFPGLTPMMPLTALALLLLSAALGLLTGHRAGAPRTWGVLAALGAAAIGGITLAEYGLSWEAGIDRLLFPVAVGDEWPMYPGRPSSISAACLVLLSLGTACLPLARGARPLRGAVQVAALLSATATYFVFLGYVYDVSVLYAILSDVPMAFHTSLALMALSVTVVAATPGARLPELFASPTAGGRALRRLAAPTLMGPIALGWLRIAAERAGLLPAVFGTALMVLTLTLVSLGFLWWSASQFERAEAALQRSEARLREVLEASPDALVLADTTGRVVFANACAADLFAYGPGALIGQQVEALVPVDLREVHHMERASFALPTDPAAPGAATEIVGLRQDGSRFPAEVRLSPVHAPDGLLIAVSVRDLTDRQRILNEAARRALEAEQARELARVKDYLLSTISHEMKTPVSLIVGYAELLEERYPDEEVVAGLMEGARRLAVHMTRIVDLGALLSGAMPLYRSEIDPLELVEAAFRMEAPEIARGCVRWRAELAPDLPPFEGDAHRLAQMVAELVDNACRFTPPGGEVGVRLARAGERIVLTVWDTGPGIAPAQLAQVWEAFNQVRTSDTLRPGGLGLGLALVKGIAELHGGRVTLECPPGGGTRVQVWLPTSGPKVPQGAGDEQRAPEV